jgi:hypothetical protein
MVHLCKYLKQQGNKIHYSPSQVKEWRKLCLLGFNAIRKYLNWKMRRTIMRRQFPHGDSLIYVISIDFQNYCHKKYGLSHQPLPLPIISLRQ